MHEVIIGSTSGINLQLRKHFQDLNWIALMVKSDHKDANAFKNNSCGSKLYWALISWLGSKAAADRFFDNVIRHNNSNT
jgi:hypothetical protein